MRPYAWVCRKCNKFDFADVEEQLAKPEHVSYRGVDLGTCKGKMIPLYTLEQLEPEEKEWLEDLLSILIDGDCMTPENLLIDIQDFVRMRLRKINNKKEE